MNYDNMVGKLNDLGFVNLVNLLDPEDLRAAFACPSTYKKHPVVGLLSAVDCIDPACDRDYQVLVNTEIGLKGEDMRDWAGRTLRRYLRDDFGNAAGALAEIRTVGLLRDGGVRVTPVPRQEAPTPDFMVSFPHQQATVEVHCKQLNDAEGKALTKYFEDIRGKAGVHEKVLMPAGTRKRGETVAENVASKFAQIKLRAHQASMQQPSVLWLDVQDEDCRAISPDFAQPVTSWNGEFFSGGLWHAIYGQEGTFSSRGMQSKSGHWKTTGEWHMTDSFARTRSGLQ